MNKLNFYNVYVKITIKGESEEDALDSLNTAIDMCDLLDQDGIVGVDVIDDAGSITTDDDLNEEE